MQLPIYRARKIDSNGYIEGYHEFISRQHILHDDKHIRHYSVSEVNESILSVHLDETTDINGKKIFASLSENWKGGDIVSDGDTGWCLMFSKKDGCFKGREINDFNLKLNLHYWNFKTVSKIEIKQ